MSKNHTNLKERGASDIQSSVFATAAAGSQPLASEQQETSLASSEKRKCLLHSVPVNVAKENSSRFFASPHVTVTVWLSARGKLQVSLCVKRNESQDGGFPCVTGACNVCNAFSCSQVMFTLTLYKNWKQGEPASQAQTSNILYNIDTFSKRWKRILWMEITVVKEFFMHFELWMARQGVFWSTVNLPFGMKWLFLEVLLNLNLLPARWSPSSTFNLIITLQKLRTYRSVSQTHS